MIGMYLPFARLRDRDPLPNGAMVLAIALVLRIAAAFFMPDQRLLDAAVYRRASEAAWAIVPSDTLIMPLYPTLVGFFGSGLGQVIFDIVLSTLMAWIVYELTLAVFADRAAARIAGLVTACYPHFIFYAVIGVPDTLFMVLLLGAFVAWYRGAFVWASIFAVLAILTRPTFDLLAPILVLYFALVYHRLPQGRAARHLATYAAVYLALMSPWWLHNYKAYGTFVRLDLGSGLALYSSNNPRGPVVDSPESDPDRARFSAIADPVARDRAMWDAGVSYIKQDPGRFAALAGRKFLRFWRPWPDAQAFADRSYFVLSVASFAPVLVLSFVYLRIWGRREIELTAPILMLVGYFTAYYVVLDGSPRYRLPLEPFLIALAAVAFVRIVGRWPEGRLVMDRIAYGGPDHPPPDAREGAPAGTP
jgi:4-amino-4-deoxy-L-arabinose transferase-like glycosyltransferase